MGRRWFVVVAATSVVLVTAGCGDAAGDSATPEEVKAVTRQFFEALIDDRNGEACALTVTPDECLGDLRSLEENLGELDFGELLGDDWRAGLKAAEVTSTGDDSVTITSFTESVEPITLLRMEGEWLIIWEVSGSPG